MIEYEVPLGNHITLAAEQAINMANRHGEPVKFEFNGIPCVAHPGSDVTAISKAFVAAAQLRSEVAALHRSLEQFQRLREMMEEHAKLSKELVAALERCQNP